MPGNLELEKEFDDAYTAEQAAFTETVLFLITITRGKVGEKAARKMVGEYRDELYRLIELYT